MAGKPPEAESAGSSAHDYLHTRSRNRRHEIDDRRLADRHGQTVPGREALPPVPPDDDITFRTSHSPKMGKCEASSGIRFDGFVPR
jgi:hypothetical protein